MAKWKPEFKVNGIAVPIPDNYEQLLSDLTTESSGRTLDGAMHKATVAVKTTMSLKWSDLEWTEAAELMNAVDGVNKMTASCIDVRRPYQMTEVTIYIGDRTSTPSLFETDGKAYWNIEFKLIQI